MSGKRDMGRHRLHTVIKILEKDHVKARGPPGGHVYETLRLMTLEEAKEVCRDRSAWCSVLSDSPARDTA